MILSVKPQEALISLMITTLILTLLHREENLKRGNLFIKKLQALTHPREERTALKEPRNRVQIQSLGRKLEPSLRR
jgi:hypothetical protein